MAKPSVSPETEVFEQERLVPLYRVVLLDDNDHTYDYVIEMLQKIFIFSLDQAYRHAEEVDRAGRTVDFRLSVKRDVAAAKAFFRKAIKGQHDAPRTITLDGYAASHRAVRELKAEGLLPAETKLRSSKYLNNLIEQDHRGVKQRIATMLGFKGFAAAAITIAGIELMHRIRKGQFGLGRLGVQGRLAPAVWNAVLQA